MDRTDSLRSPGTFPRVFRRVLEVSTFLENARWKQLAARLQARTKLSRRNLGRLKGGTLLAASLALAVSAHRISSGQGALAWEHAHPPSAQIWDFALGQQGLRALDSPDALQRVIRTAPGSWDDQGSVWASAGFEWVLVFVDPKQEIPFRVYTKTAHEPPPRSVAWRRVGSGWTGFESLMRELEGQPRPLAPKRKPVQPNDPREIRY